MSEKLKSLNKILIFFLLIVFIPLIIAGDIFLFEGKHVYIVSALVIIISMIPFFLIFESRKPRSRELVAVAVMIAVAVASRALLWMLPQAKLIAYVVIVTSICFGAEIGFLVGSLSMFISNFFFGMGAFMPFQMLGLGLVGYFSGLIFFKKKIRNNRIAVSIVGTLLTFFVFGAIADLSMVAASITKINFAGVVSIMLAGVPMNLVFAAVTGIALFFTERQLSEKLIRTQVKYNLFGDNSVQ